jgi:hypothetical protein
MAIDAAPTATAITRPFLADGDGEDDTGAIVAVAGS